MAQLGDLLAGAAGATFSRPALNAAVTQGQALAGLRTAQTEEALQNAARAREENEASDQLESAISGMQGPDGKPMLTPSQAHAAALDMKFRHGSAKDALAAVQEAQKAGAMNTLGDPSQLNTPAQTAASQVTTGKLAEPVKVPEEFAMPAGVSQPNVQETPQGQAKIDTTEAQAMLRDMQAKNPQAFHAGGFGNVPPEMLQGIINYVRQNPNAAPTGRSLFTPAGAAVANELSGGANPPPGNGVTPAAGVSMKEQSDIRHDFANGTAAKQTSALNTMVQHSQLFDQIADQLKNNNFTPTNAIANTWQRLFGSPVPGNLQIAGEFLGREAVRATVNSGAGTGEERELKVGTNAGPDQLHGAAQTLRTLAAGQLHSLELRAKRGGVDITQLLGDEAKRAYGLGQPPSTTVAAPGAAPTGAPDLGALARAELQRRGIQMPGAQ